ncbi:MAG: hypothetical protein LBF12_03645 [Christensenellaceae bacterium]|jgi:hypothetical protein|nr:hypothetical protein [Christensenellaceae bacterium]
MSVFDNFHCVLLPDYYKKSKITTSVFDPEKSALKFNEVAVIFGVVESKNYLVLIPAKDNFDDFVRLIFTIQHKIRFVEVVENSYSIVEYIPVTDSELQQILRLKCWFEISSTYKTQQDS